MRNVFDSAVVPGHERVEAWRHVTGAALVATELHIPEPSAFTARLDAMSLGIAQVSAVSYASLSSRRTPRLIRRSDPEQYQVGLIRTGRQGIEQNRTRDLIHPGELVVYDSSRPLDAFVDSTPPAAESVILQLPKRLLPLPEARVARLLAVPLSATSGICRLLTQFLVTLADRADWTERDALRLGHTAVDLTSAVLAHYLDDDTPPPISPTHVLYLRITSFIDQNLHEPDLGPAAIAAVHHISVRYLHRIFQQHHDTGVSAYIRTRRLDRCRRDLADPNLRHLTISAIATHWGFARAAEFSRTFRRETGVSPSSYRIASHVRSLDTD
ncbi:helix-turn-helix domain-containing protein [Saccharothrix obliqua]|uniref:helix-turn-helix domain-containing protein n=1 Tax=Saccharothrix obliqua TaxID=2861747 RepID=UPI001C5DFA85|nr:helix-turn-helix domain-containing protein [Saccharothrix obliqua]MBW4721320.1 helix-turn-helix domain-containing protein [Saccharothrix obliqua]